MKPGDAASVTFPIEERSDTVLIQKARYELLRRGSEVVEIDPPGRYAPLYQRSHYRQPSTRWRWTQRFVSERPVYW
jgi:hypothetical protein